MQTTIHRIVDAETILAGIDNRQATITVRFISQQENILRDASQRVIGGTPGKVE